MVSKDGIIIDRREMLRVKIKSLTAEAKIIRREESRTRGMLQCELHEHRVKELRWEARDTHIAYGFIRGLKWEQMEPKRDEKSEPRWKRVREMCKKYGPQNFVEPEVLQKAA